MTSPPLNTEVTRRVASSTLGTQSFQISWSPGQGLLSAASKPWPLRGLPDRRELGARHLREFRLGALRFVLGRSADLRREAVVWKMQPTQTNYQQLPLCPRPPCGLAEEEPLGPMLRILTLALNASLQMELSRVSRGSDKGALRLPHILPPPAYSANSLLPQRH